MKRRSSTVVGRIAPLPFNPDAKTISHAWRSINARLPKSTPVRQRRALRRMWYLGIGWTIFQLEARMTSDGSADWFDRLVDDLSDELDMRFLTQRFRGL